MYNYVVIAHGWWRWVVIAAGLYAVASAARSLSGNSGWSGGPARAGRMFGITVDIQFLMGASLYLIFSPLTTVAVAVSDGLPAGSDLRFFGVYHGLAMTLAWLMVHVSAVLIRRARSDAARCRRSVLFYGVTLALIVAAIPWWRPLLRF